jgi:signal transduction histidine kinase/ligand-binding sensor domain-containing protein
MLPQFVAGLARSSRKISSFRAASRLWLLLCLLCSATAFAQHKPYRFDHWTAETGLPQNIISAITQTPEGYLWIATLDGLTRFDGVRFTVFNKSNTPGISTNRFNCLYQDLRGDLWAGTEVGAVTRYHEGQFITYATEQGLPKSNISGLTGDQQGHIWVLSGNKIREWEPNAGRFIELDSPPFSGGPQGLARWNEESGFWGLDQAGLHLFAGGVWTHFALPAKVDRPITQVAREGDGTIWVAVAGERIFRLKDGKATPFPHRNTQPHGPATHARLAARPMTEWRDRAGKIWEMEIVQKLFRQLTIPSSGQPETITLNTSYEDRDGNLWLGTDGQGLYRIRKQIVTTWSQEQGLIGRNVYPIYEDRAGTVWVGGWEGGLSQIKAGKITNFATREGLSAGGVTAFCEDRAGRMWIATHTDLQTFEQGRFTSVKAQYMPDQTTVNAIYQDRTGAMWFGTDHGLFRHYHGQAQRFTLEDGLPGDAVRVIIEAAEGGMWIGCTGGLMRWRDGQITTWTEREKLPGSTMRALYEDQGGVLWIGTYDSGLGRFKDGKFTRYTTREGLFNDGVFQILEDDYGNLWMSSNRGIYRVRKQELNEFAAGHRREITSIAFGKNDGMLNVECNGGKWPAGVRSRDGRLWFPTQDGVAMVDPAAVTTNQQPPPVLIEEVLLDRTPIAFRDGMRLQPGHGNLEIQYTAPSFNNAAWSRFKYKIEGLDRDWIDAGTRRAAFFSYLPPGEYTFRVIAANSDGIWNLQGQSLRITVLPPFYRAWWFLTLAALGLTAVLALGYKYRIRQLERERSAQRAFSRQLIQSQESERKRIAAELHDSLGQRLLVIKNWAALSLMASPGNAPAREQLNEISENASLALEETRQIVFDLRPYQLDKVGLTSTLKFTVEQIAVSSGIDITARIAELDGTFSLDDEISFYRIVQECLNNIVKHSGATQARVLIERDSAIRLQVSDNGRGFALDTLDQKERGFGLSGIAERARMLGGDYSIESEPGNGVTIRITIGRLKQ